MDNYHPSQATLKDAERFYRFLKKENLMQNAEIGVTTKTISSFSLSLPQDSLIVYVPERFGVKENQRVTVYPVPEEFKDAWRFVIYSVPKDAVRKLNKGLERTVADD